MRKILVRLGVDLAFVLGIVSTFAWLKYKQNVQIFGLNFRVLSCLFVANLI